MIQGGTPVKGRVVKGRSRVIGGQRTPRHMPKGLRPGQLSLATTASVGGGGRAGAVRGSGRPERSSGNFGDCTQENRHRVMRGRQRPDGYGWARTRLVSLQRIR
jgi:hypothetical protein